MRHNFWMKRFFLFIIIILYIIFHITFLDKYPLIWVDDGIYIEPAWWYLKYGRFASEQFSGFIKLEITNAIWGRLYLLSKSISFLIFDLGPFQGRIPSLFFAFLSLGLFYLLFCTLYNKKVAIIATILLGISQKFIFHSHDGRPEIMVLCFMICSILLVVLGLKKNSPVMLFLSGLIASLNMDVHPNGGLSIFIVIAIFFLTNVDSFKAQKKFFVNSNFLYLLFGITVGVSWWIFVHIIIPGRELFIYQWKHYWYGINLPPIGKPILDILKKEFLRYYSFFWLAKFQRNMLLLPIFIGSCLYSLKKASYGDKIIIIVIVMTIVFFLFMCGNPTTIYLILLFPFLVGIVVRTILDIKPKIVRMVVLLFLFVFFFLELCFIIIKFHSADYTGYIKKLKKYIPEHTVIMGDSTYWYGFAKTNKYYSDNIFWYLTQPSISNFQIYASSLGRTFEECMKLKNIEYIIAGERFWWTYKLIEKEVKKFLETYYTKIAEIEDNYHGTGDPVGRYGEKIITEIYKKK